MYKVMDTLAMICFAGVMLGFLFFLWVFVFGAISDLMGEEYQECGYTYCKAEEK